MLVSLQRWFEGFVDRVEPGEPGDQLDVLLCVFGHRAEDPVDTEAVKQPVDGLVGEVLGARVVHGHVVSQQDGGEVGERVGQRVLRRAHTVGLETQLGLAKGNVGKDQPQEPKEGVQELIVIQEARLYREQRHGLVVHFFFSSFSSSCLLYFTLHFKNIEINRKKKERT